MRGVVRFMTGGRSQPPLSGYRPQLKVGNIQTSCLIEGEPDQVFTFDADHVVRFRLIFQAHYGFAFAPGAAMDLYEGSRKVGTLAVLAGK